MSENRTIIKSLRMQNFGCFADKTVEFGDGFNQIVGPNESGKSTIIKALSTAIFEDGSTTKKAVEGSRAWASEGQYKLTLLFTVGDKQFTLIRDYAADKDLMTDSDGIVYEGKAINDKLHLYFGASDRALYEAIFCVSSDDPDAPETARNRLQSAIETPVLSGFDRGGADRYLDEEIKKLDNPRAHSPRELDMISDKISVALQEKTELEDRQAALEKDRKELEEVREKGAEYEERVDHLEKEVEGAEAYTKVNERMVSLEERLQVHLNNFSRASQMVDDLKRITEQIEDFKIPEPEEMEEITRRRDEVGGDVEEAKKKMDEIILRRNKSRRGLWAATALLVLLCAAYVVFRQGGFQSETIGTILPYTVPVMILVWTLRLSVFLMQCSKKGRATAIFRQQVGRMDKFYADLNTQYDLRAADPVKALEESIQWHKALEMSAKNLKDTINTLSEGKGLEELNRVKAILETEVAGLNKELAPLTSFAASSHKLPELKEELTVKRVRANALRERAALLTERCSAITAIDEQMAKVDKQIEALKRQHHEVTERLEVLKVTRLALNRAADQLIEDTFAAYSEEASLHLSALTDGRYEEAHVTKDPCRFELKIHETGKWVEITDALSSSTRDCVYLALRLAGVSHLGAEFQPPIILDQAETRMDGNRRQNLLRLLQGIALDRQILYLTPERLDGVPDVHLIALEESEIAVPQADTV